MKERYNHMMEQICLDDHAKEAMLARLTQSQGGARTTKRKMPLPRRMLLAACLAAALAASALAGGWLGGWESFFGKVPDNVTTPVGVSAQSGDYTIALEETIVDEDGAAFLLSLRRTDGGVLEGEPQLSGNTLHWDIKVDGKRPHRTMTQQEPVRSEDGRSIYYCLEFQDEGVGPKETVINKEITFVCNGVVDASQSEEFIRAKTETISLAPMAKAAPTVEQSWEELFTDVEKRSENLSRLAEEMTECRIPLALGDGQVACVSSVIFTADGPAVAVDWMVDRYEKGQYVMMNAFPVRLTDTRTGKSWENSQGVAEGKNTGIYVALFGDCPLTAEELSRVELSVDYKMDKVLSDQQAELSFRVENSGVVTKELDQMVGYGDLYYEGRLSYVRISALRIRLYMVDADRVGSFDGQRQLVMEDGDKVTVHFGQRRIDTDLGRGWLDLEPRDAQGNRIIIDPTKVIALQLDDTRIDLK